MISSAPILKHQTFFLRELAYIQIIQPVPDDLSILAHIVSIYWWRVYWWADERCTGELMKDVLILEWHHSPSLHQLSILVRTSIHSLASFTEWFHLSSFQPCRLCVIKVFQSILYFAFRINCSILKGMLNWRIPRPSMDSKHVLVLVYCSKFCS